MSNIETHKKGKALYQTHQKMYLVDKGNGLNYMLYIGDKIHEIKMEKIDGNIVYTSAHIWIMGERVPYPLSLSEAPVLSYYSHTYGQ